MTKNIWLVVVSISLKKTAGQWGSLQISFNSLLIVKLAEGHLNRQKWELPVVTTTKRGVNQSSN
jgi:hypothetical protein